MSELIINEGGALNQEIISEFTYQFDTFQIESCKSLELGHHVLCLAHTSAGKSTIAYYAIAKALLEKKRLIYTAPVKSLSNQKYAELKLKYGEQLIGLATGDNKINMEADIVVMTTEILRNLLSKPIWGSKSDTETVQDATGILSEEVVSTGYAAENVRLAYVVFDEAHYINDRSRGNVYEECIMKLPNHVQMIFLSATMANPEHFQNWVQSIKPDRAVGVSCTIKRPVPLCFYIFVPKPDTFDACLPWNEAMEQGHLQIILNGEHGIFQNEIYQEMVKRFRNIVDFKMIKVKSKLDEEGLACKDIISNNNTEAEPTLKQVRRQIPFNMSGMLNKFISFLSINEQLPAIFFTLSRKKCNALANQVTESTLITHVERREIEDIFNHHIRALKEYETYRQVNELRSLLLKGIGVHHSGMITLLKEIVEIIFTKGLIKVMFATETLAIGVNTPTRVTCFTDVLKFDGYSNCKRVLTIEEFKQMAGRAGRRGLDTVGNVIYFPVDEPLLLPEIRSMLQGSLRILASNFEVTTQYILRLLKSIDLCTENHLLQATRKSLLSIEMQLQHKAQYIEVDQYHLDIKKLNDDMDKIVSKTKSLKDIYELQVSIQTSKLGQNQLKKQKQKLQNMEDNLTKQEKNDYIKYIEIHHKAEKLQLLIDQLQHEMGIPSDTIITSQIVHTIQFLLDSGFIYHLNNTSTSSYYSSHPENILLLTQQGLFASCITQCHEIALTKAIFSGLGDSIRHDPMLLTAWLSLFIGNEQDEKQSNKKDCPTSKSLPDYLPEELNDVCLTTMEIVENLFIDMHNSYKVYSEVLDKSPPYQLYTVYVSPMLSWIQKSEHFEHICLNHGFFEGNYVKALQKMVNLFNELLVAFEITNQPEWINCVQRVKEEFLYGILLVDSIYL